MELSRKLSVWYVIAIPVIAGLSSLDIRIGELNYTGYIWALMLPVGLYLLAVNRLSGVSPGGIFNCWPWLIWVGYVCLSLLWCDDLTPRNVQDALQLCMPIVVGLLAASAIRSSQELRSLFAAFGVGLGLFALFTLVYLMQIFDTEWMGTDMRGVALATVLVGCVFLAQFPQRKFLSLAGWGACVLITTLTSSRIATLALLVVPIAHPYFRGRILTKSLALGACCVLGLLLFNTKTFQQHFFRSGEGTVSDVLAGDYDDLGRFDAWSAVWNQAWHRPWLGTGVGVTYTFVPTVWDEDMHHVHNDYLRIFFEEGAVGLAIFIFAVVWQLLNLRRQIVATQGIVRDAFAAALLGLCAMLISCATDNTITYTVVFTNPLFAILGAAYGVAYVERLPMYAEAAGSAAPALGNSWIPQAT